MNAGPDCGKSLRRAGRAAALAIVIGWPGVPAAAAQTVDARAMSAEAKKDRDVDIEADRMEVFDDKKRAVFSGNVEAVRGDVRLKSDKLVVDYKAGAKGEGGKKTEVTQIEATGGVDIKSGSQRITGKMAHMDVKANVLTITGDVVVYQGGTIIRGEELVVDLNTSRSQFKGSAASGGRVKSSFSPEQ